MKNLNYLTDYNLYQIFENILSMSSRKKKNETVTDNPSIKIYGNKIGNWLAFKIKTECYPELLRPDTSKLLRSTKCKITKVKNGENVPHFEITKLVLIHCNIQEPCTIEESCIHLFLINHFVDY